LLDELRASQALARLQTDAGSGSAAAPYLRMLPYVGMAAAPLLAHGAARWLGRWKQPKRSNKVASLLDLIRPKAAEWNPRAGAANDAGREWTLNGWLRKNRAPHVVESPVDYEKVRRDADRDRKRFGLNLPQDKTAADHSTLYGGLAGALLGGGYGYVRDRLTHEKQDRDPVSSALIGAAVGGSLGAYMSLPVKARTVDSDDSTVFVDEDDLDSVAKSVKHESLKDNVEHYYAKAPGGFSGAADRAVKSHDAPDAGPLRSKLKFNKDDLAKSFKVTDLGAPFSLNGLPVSGVTKLDGMSPPEIIVDGVSPFTKEHELTHAAEDFLPAMRGHAVLPGELPSSLTADAIGDYFEGPTELAPRLADIKRKFVAAHPGRDVSTPRDARDALKWWRKHLNGFGRFQEHQPHIESWDSWEKRHPPGDPASKAFWDGLIDMMPGLVLGERAPGHKAAALGRTTLLATLATTRRRPQRRRVRDNTLSRPRLPDTEYDAAAAFADSLARRPGR
jgi:hypothetical protein